MNYLKEKYKKTNIENIPNEWKIDRLSNLFSITAGRDLIKNDFSLYFDDEHRFPIYSNSLENKGLYGYTKYPRHKANSITVTARGTLGKASARAEDFDAIGRLLVLEPKIVLDCFFVSEYINEKLHFSIESTGVPQLTVPHISKYFIALPPLNEQKKISSILSTVDDLIENTESLINYYTLLKKGLMQILLTKGIGHTKFKKTEIGEIPNNWNIVKIKYITELISKKGEPGKNNYIEISDINIESKKYDFKDKKSVIGCKYAFKENIIVSNVRPTRGAISIIKEPQVLVSSGFTILSCKKDIKCQFLFYNLIKDDFLNYLGSCCEGSTYPTVNSSDLIEYKIPLPPLDEQIQISSILILVDEKLDINRNKIILLNSLKKGLMQQLLTGKIRVKV